MMNDKKVWITDVRLNDPEPIPVGLDTPTEENTKWRIFKYENETAINTNTFHTFDLVFQHLEYHMTAVVERTTGVKLMSVELPQRDTAKIQSDQTPRELTQKTELPRAVVLFDQEGFVEPLVAIPTMQRLNRSAAGLSYAITTVRATDPVNLPDTYNWFKDINFTLSATPRWSAFTLKYNILLSNYPQGREILGILQGFFPVGEITPIYAEKRKTSQYGADWIPYTVESEIPNHIINVMKRTFDIPESDEFDTNTIHDEALYNILKTWSDNRIDYKVIGGERRFRFVTTYATPIHITCNGINFDTDRVNRANSTSVVSIEFNVMYLDLSTFRIGASLLKLNPKNRANQGDPHVEGMKVYTLPFTEQFEKLTVINKESLQYEASDRRIDPDILDKTYMEVSLWDFISEGDHFLEYVQYLYKERERLNFSQFFKVEVKRGMILNNEDPVVGTDVGIEIDYEKMVFRDPKGKPQMVMYLAFYIRKDHFVDWKEKNGYIHQRNLSGIRNIVE